MKVLDWIYSHNEGNGFNLYTYTDSFYDYSYQYLISWYGKEKYGFYPCEYANFPLAHKYLYIPGAEKYNTPQLGCDKFRFLIIDSTTNGNKNKGWINEFRDLTIFVEKTQIGNTTIEKLSDTITKSIHPVLKQVKDIAAGAVCLVSIISFIIGCIIFLPKIQSLIKYFTK